MDIYTRIAELKARGEAFAIATVVGRQAPVSSHLGDKALIFEDGTLEGYIGGSCSREIVRRQALEALKTGKPRLVKITPEAAAKATLAQAEEVVVPMTCASEGAVEVYLEPQVGKAQLLIVGGTQIALSTAQIAARMSFMVTLACDQPELVGVTPDADIQVMSWKDLEPWLAAQNPSRTQVLIASQGHYDEDALVLLSKAMSDPAYLGLVASPKRGATVLENLEILGVPRPAFPGLKYPAGLDLGAKTPDEVAVSILAEMVMVKNAERQTPNAERQTLKAERVVPVALEPVALEVVQTVQTALAEVPELLSPGFALDPTSGERLEIAKAVSAEYGGTTYYFSCANCRAKFLKNPQKYLKGRA